MLAAATAATSVLFGGEVADGGPDRPRRPERARGQGRLPGRDAHDHRRDHRHGRALPARAARPLRLHDAHDQRARRPAPRWAATTTGAEALRATMREVPLRVWAELGRARLRTARRRRAGRRRHRRPRPRRRRPGRHLRQRLAHRHRAADPHRRQGLGRPPRAGLPDRRRRPWPPTASADGPRALARRARPRRRRGVVGRVGPEPRPRVRVHPAGRPDPRQRPAGDRVRHRASRAPAPRSARA